MEQDNSESDYVSKCMSHVLFSSHHPQRRKFNDPGSDSDEDNNSLQKVAKKFSSKQVVKKNSSHRPQIDLNNLDNPVLSKAENDMIRLAGGPQIVESIALQYEEMLNSGSRRLKPRISGGDTILMEKCIQMQPLSDKPFWSKNHAQILAYTRLMTKHNPKLLVQRNSQVILKAQVHLAFD